jgi:hypothetical protein
MYIEYHSKSKLGFNQIAKRMLVEGCTQKYVYGFELKNIGTKVLKHYKIYKKNEIRIIRIEETIVDKNGIKETFITEEKHNHYCHSYILKTI